MKNSLQPLWDYIKDVQSLQGWMVKAGFAAPLLPMIVHLGPPWNSSSWLQDNTAIVMLTAIVQLVALTTVFALTACWTSRRLKNYLKWSGVGCALLLLAYTILFLLVTCPHGESWDRHIRGCTPTEYFTTLLRNNNGSEKDAFADAGADPRKCYEEPCLTGNYISLVVLWLIFFGSLTTYTGLFVRTQTCEDRWDEHPLSELKLEHRIQSTLEAANIRTIGALTSKTRQELLDIDNFGQVSLLKVENALREKGLCLKGSPLAKGKEITLFDAD